MPTRTKSRWHVDPARSAAAKQRWADRKAKQEAQGAPAPAPASATPYAEGPSSDLGVLADAFRNLAQRQDADLEEAVAALNRIDLKRYPELLKLPAMERLIEQASEAAPKESRDDPPGTVYRAHTISQTKKSWTRRDMENFPKVRVLPTTTEIVFFQGLDYRFEADVEVEVPAPFAAIYLDARRAVRRNDQHAKFLFGQPTPIEDPSVLGVSSYRVRAHGTGGVYAPGTGVGGAPGTSVMASETAEGEGASEEE